MPGKRRANAVMTLITALIAVAAGLACAFPVLGLEEGTFLHAVLRPVHAFLDRYVNVFASEGLRPYGLIPFALLCLLNLFLAIRGSGILQFILRCVAFYSLCLLAFWFQDMESSVPAFLPSWYLYIAAGSILFCVVLLALILRVKMGSRAASSPEGEGREGTGDFPQVGDEIPSGFPGAGGEPDGSQEPEEEPYVRDPQEYKKSVGSLSSVKTPEFQTFPNYSLTASVSSVDRGMYDVAEREAKIRYEEQKKREAEIERRRREEEKRRRKAEEEEKERLRAEEEKKRLQDMFKPRTLLKRLNEDAQAEKTFPTYGADFGDVDYGISERRESPAPEVAVSRRSSQYQQQQASRTQKFSGREMMQDIPVAQMMGPYAFSTPVDEVPAGQSEREYEPERDYGSDIGYASETDHAPEYASDYGRGPEVPAPQKSVFKEATARAEQDAEIASRKRQAEMERRHLEEMQELERHRREAEEAARRAEEELAATRAEMQRRQEEARAEAEARAAQQRIAAAHAPEPEEEEDGISDEDMAANDAKERSKGPDIDMVSGVAGLKSSFTGNPYLLDKQKFDYKFPPESLLKHYPISARIYDDPENDPDGRTIVETFRQFRIETNLVGVQHGPTFTLYELTLAKGIKVSSVTSYSENIAMELSVEDVRILAPIPGKPAIGVEVPNKKRDTIGFDVMMPALKAKFFKIPMVLGKTITGDSIVIDVAKTPHLLVAGTTGSGKSVCINGLICSVLYTKTPKDVRMILVDPKMVELSLYNGIPHLLTPVITDAKKALKAMNFVVEEMERRMALFSSIGAKKIEEYNQKIVEKKMAKVKLTYIMVIIDEFADLMLAVGKELETSIKRITAVARFCGIHLILATQRPSSDVITGIIKSNIPTQIAFAVSNSTNSRIIIDQVGAEKLLGRGDMLYNNPESRQPLRIQGAFIDSEIEEIVAFVKTQGEPDYIDESYFEDDDEDEEEEDEEAAGGGSEDLFSRAWKIVTDRGEASASYLQRKLGIGYNRAANLIEQMEEAGYIGPARGSKPREILRYYGSE